MPADTLSLTFAALAHPARRAILARLSLGQTSVQELCKPLKLSGPAMTKHLKSLERGGLISRSREAQWRPCKLEAAPIENVASWINELKASSQRSLDRLDAYLQSLQSPTPRPESKENSVLETEAFSISRDLKAPRALVYEVQTDAKHLANWLSAEGFKTVHAAMDFRVGGRYHYCQEGPGGAQMWGLQRFREIVPNEKIVLVQSFSDKDGGLARHPMAPEWPLELLATTTFEDIGPKMTRTTISWRPYNSDEAGIRAFDAGRTSMTGGFAGVFKKLEAYLAQLQG